MKNDVITITFPPEKKGSYMNPENKGLSIVYEDEDIIIINKPPGLVTMPSRLHPSGTLANRVLGYYQRKSIPYTVHVVTRLDRDTSGLILIAKHRYSHSLLASDQNKGKLIRRYKAIVEGDVEQREGIIDAPIRRKPGSIIERQVSETGQRAITHYKVEKEGAGHSLLAVELLTGRTHQIRVHFSSIHHPLAGDDLYGGSKKVIDRQALHCYEISFQHPLTKEPILIQLDMPQDMSSIIK